MLHLITCHGRIMPRLAELLFNIIYTFLGAIFEPCCIQNRVITNCVIKGSWCISNLRNLITYSFVKCGYDLFFPQFCKFDMLRYSYLEVFQRVP